MLFALKYIYRPSYILQMKSQQLHGMYMFIIRNFVRRKNNCLKFLKQISQESPSSLFVPDWDPLPPGDITQIFIKLVETEHPFVQDPLGSCQYWTSAVYGSMIFMSITKQTKPKGCCSFSWPELDHLIIVVEGCGSSCWSISQPGHDCAHNVSCQFQMFSFRRQLFP